jgi:uncharacterized protein YqhQ
MAKELKLPSYGGQALIEGVLMRGKFGLAAAMRAPDGQIIIQKEPLKGIYTTGIRKIPFLRGILLLWDALGLGMKYLTLSANTQTGEDEKIDGPTLYLTLAATFAVAIAVFFVGPAMFSQWLEGVLGLSSWVGNLIEGILRLGLTVGYIWGVGRMQEIKEVFAYHGAEHKTINAFEDDAELTPEIVKRYPLEHPRCGTSFMLTLVLLSILLFASLGPLSFLWRAITRIIFIPILAGISYEYLRWTADHMHYPLVRSLSRPNLALQKLTTAEPSLEALEVSIAAFTTMLAQEKELESASVILPSPEQ